MYVYIIHRDIDIVPRAIDICMFMYIYIQFHVDLCMCI